MKMNNYNFILLSFFILYGCGSSESSDTQFYKTEKTTSQVLEVSIEASGVIEAISSVEIKLSLIHI